MVSLTPEQLEYRVEMWSPVASDSSKHEENEATYRSKVPNN
jgi:hypothetical protein